MKCLYYLSPNLETSKKVSDDLHSIGIEDWYLHIVSKDESGLTQKHIHSSNYLETLDLVRGTSVGAAIGCVAGIILALIMYVTKPFGPEVPTFVYFIIIGLLVLFGTWEGGLYGIDTENKKLGKFHDDVASGKDLILIYAARDQEDSIKGMMNEKHSESELVAVDTHFINPFSKFRRLAH